MDESIKNVYFLGIGGIGMSALARYFKASGYRVAGYDRTPSALTEKMRQEEGMIIGYIMPKRRMRRIFRKNSWMCRPHWSFIRRQFLPTIAR